MGLGTVMRNFSDGVFTLISINRLSRGSDIKTYLLGLGNHPKPYITLTRREDLDP